MEEQIREEKRKRRVRASLRMFVIGFVIALVLCVAYCLISGRFMTGEEYEFYKEYRASYGKYYDLMNFIDENALNEYKGSKLDDSIYRDIIASLNDPYAAYYTPEEYANFEKKFAESYIGIGIAVSDVDGKVVVLYTVEGAPAEEAGFKAGDIIEAVDGKKVKDSTDTTNRIGGEVGTEVKVTVNRDGSKKVYTVTRQQIEEKSVKYSKVDKKKKIACIQISMFKTDTYQEFKNAVKDLKNDGYEKIIIDLRNNGGGSTKEAYDIADYLLPECDIVTVVNKDGKKNIVKSDSKTAELDYVILVNQGTASASEIVVCAVQDNQGGKIIGSKTYGKGVTQMIHKLSDGSVVKVTIEEYLRPNGGKVNTKGITPDIIVKNPLDDDEIMPLAIKALSK